MIKPKLKICKTCQDPSYIFSHGNCRRCAGLKKLSEKPKFKPLTQTESGKVAKVFKYQTKAIKRTKSKTVEQINRKAEIDLFFDEQALQVPERCENCNLKLNAFSKWAKRFVTAHIVPKNDKEFPSVATHAANRMFLGVHLFSECGCHAEWDNSDANHRKTMPCYKLALSRAQGFYDELTPHEQVKFDKYLGVNITPKSCLNY